MDNEYVRRLEKAKMKDAIERKRDMNLRKARQNAHAWGATEFEQLVLDGNPRAAVFDCDGTLWRGDAAFGFLTWSLEQGLVSRSTSDWIDDRHRAYRAGQVDELTICGEMVQIYAGLQEQEIKAAAASYFDEYVRPRYFTEIVALIGKLQASDVEIWAVSSTNRWVIAEGVGDFGIPAERILAAEVRIEDGVVTSSLIAVPTDEGKAEALRQVGLARPDAVFGNSIHDLAMLEMARNPFPVNPSPALFAAASERGWGYFMPSDADADEAEVGGEQLPPRTSDPGSA
jgi:phosphoserine phosphatase